MMISSGETPSDISKRLTPQRELSCSVPNTPRDELFLQRQEMVERVLGRKHSQGSIIPVDSSLASLKKDKANKEIRAARRLSLGSRSLSMMDGLRAMKAGLKEIRKSASSSPRGVSDDSLTDSFIDQLGSPASIDLPLDQEPKADVTKLLLESAVAAGRGEFKKVNIALQVVFGNKSPRNFDVSWQAVNEYHPSTGGEQTRDHEIAIIRELHRRGVRHPNVTHLDIVSSQERISPAADLGEMDFADALYRNLLTRSDIVNILIGAFEGALYLHTKLVFHGDIKPDNLLLFTPGLDRRGRHSPIGSTEARFTDVGQFKLLSEQKTHAPLGMQEPAFTAPEKANRQVIHQAIVGSFRQQGLLYWLTTRQTALADQNRRDCYAADVSLEEKSTEPDYDLPEGCSYQINFEFEEDALELIDAHTAVLLRSCFRLLGWHEEHQQLVYLLKGWSDLDKNAKHERIPLVRQILVTHLQDPEILDEMINAMKAICKEI